MAAASASGNCWCFLAANGQVPPGPLNGWDTKQMVNGIPKGTPVRSDETRDVNKAIYDANKRSVVVEDPVIAHVTRTYLNSDGRQVVCLSVPDKKRVASLLKNGKHNCVEVYAYDDDCKKLVKALRIASLDSLPSSWKFYPQ
jgi:hypothetical protein